MIESPDVTPGVSLVVDGGIGWITFDNPERLNALRADMWARLPALVGEADAREDVRVIVLRGAGDKAFSAGADITEFETSRTGAAAEHYNQLNHSAFMALERCGTPTIAMIHGFCLGGGLGLAVSCDVRFCDDRARFAIPAARLGIGYHPRWIRSILATISAPHAKELSFTGGRFDSAWALRVGLVNDVVSPARLEARVSAFTSAVCENAPLSILAAKRSIDALNANPALDDLSELEALVAECFSSEDYEEGRRAFVEKRKAKFKGR